MDKFDRETLKEITRQFPKDKSIIFLTRLLKESEIEKGKLKSELDESLNSKKQYEKEYQNKLIKVDKTYIEYKKVISDNNRENQELRREIKKEEIYLQYKKDLQHLNKKLSEKQVTINSYLSTIIYLREKLKQYE